MLLMLYWSQKLQAPPPQKRIHDLGISLGYPPQLDDKVLLLKTPHIVVDYKEIKLQPRWKLPPCWQASLCQKAQCSLLGERRHQESHTAMYPTDFDTNLSGKMCLLVQQWQDRDGCYKLSLIVWPVGSYALHYNLITNT